MLAMFRTPLLLILLVLTGCSFDRQWRNMAHAKLVEGTAATEPSDALAGRWEGKWVSEQSGHSGRLRAIIKPVNGETYHVSYDARYMGILRFGYGMDLSASRGTDGKIAFEGQENLGAIAGGMYRYKGTADGTTFHSTYESSADHGYFEMSRPGVKR